MVHEMSVRVRYADTDQIRVVHPARYLKGFQMARRELLRELGTLCCCLEEEGLHVPVIEAGCRSVEPARCHDAVTVRSAMGAPLSAKVRIAYEAVPGTRLLATGYAVHAFPGPDGRPKRTSVAVF